MKRPAVALAAASAGGIALGLHPAVARHGSWLVKTGIGLLQFGRVFPTVAMDGAVHVLANGTRLKIFCFVERTEAGSVIASSMRAEIPNQKQDGEKK